MKKLIIYILIFFPLILNSCKDNDAKPSSINIDGKWELESSSSGWSSHNYEPGNGRLIIFSKKNYQYYSGDTLLHNGAYKITRATKSLTNSEGNRIFMENYVLVDFVDLYNGKLVLSVDAYDAGSSIYRKID